MPASLLTAADLAERLELTAGELRAGTLDHAALAILDGNGELRHWVLSPSAAGADLLASTATLSLRGL